MPKIVDVGAFWPCVSNSFGVSSSQFVVDLRQNDFQRITGRLKLPAKNAAILALIGFTFQLQWDVYITAMY